MTDPLAAVEKALEPFDTPLPLPDGAFGWMLVPAYRLAHVDLAAEELKAITEALATLRSLRETHQLVPREVLAQIAFTRHVRLSSSGSTVPNGYSCKICGAEWGKWSDELGLYVDELEVHRELCPLSAAAKE